MHKPSLEKIFNVNIPKGVIFQQNNSLCYTSRILTSLFKKNGVPVMKLHPKSPHLNPIENFWSVLEKKVKGPKNYLYTTTEDQALYIIRRNKFSNKCQTY